VCIGEFGGRGVQQYGRGRFGQPDGERTVAMPPAKSSIRPSPGSASINQS